MSENWEAALKELSARLTAAEERHALHTERILHTAVREAEKSVFMKLGVDVEDAESLQEFQQGLIFNRSVHRGVSKALGAIFLAMCGMIGTALTMYFWEWFKSVK